MNQNLPPESLPQFREFLTRQIQQDESWKEIPAAQLRQAIFKRLAQISIKSGVELKQAQGEALFQEVYDELTGYRLLQTFLDNPDISEVMVNGLQVYVEQKGKLVLASERFDNEAQVLRLIQRIAAPLGRPINKQFPMVDARLSDGSRVNAVVPPVALDGTSITIRKFAKERLGIKELIEYGTLTEDVAKLLEACVASRLNVIISGGTGSGKTTLLNILSSYIPEDERIVTIEDAAELRLRQAHVVRLETRPMIPGSDDTPVTIRDLVRNALRMRPERIIIGECRGGEALDMLQAMNTGHDGSLTTLHANTPRDAISRLETMVLMSGMDLPLHVIRTQIASAVNLIVQVSRLRDGRRRVTHVTEVIGMEGDTITLSDIFKLDTSLLGPDGNPCGELKPTGIRPNFSNRLETVGFKMTPEMLGINLAEMFVPRRGNGRS